MEKEVTKEGKQEEPVVVKDSNRVCYQCETNNKIVTVFRGKILVIDECCLACDREFLKKFIQTSLSKNMKFKLELGDEVKKQKFLNLMGLVLGNQP